MIQGFNTAGSALSAQQMAIDNIANNIANVNTTGFKKQGLRFQTLLNSNIKRTADGENTLTRGNGVKAANTITSIQGGRLMQTGGGLDFAINGDGFFRLLSSSGDITYTRDGAFHISNEAGGDYLVSGNGEYVIGTNGGRISVTENVLSQNIAVFGFNNPYALSPQGRNSYAVSNESGNGFPIRATVIQGYLESSNTDMVDEMTELMSVQRAYQLNAKMIQTADEIENIINNLR